MNIPKICHLYWDESPMSWLQTITIKSFHRYNPDWKIIIYLPEKRYVGNQLFVPKYTGKDYFHLVKELDYVEFQTVSLKEFGIDNINTELVGKNIPIIEDSSYYWSKQYDAKITPEVVMIDSLNTIVYKGRIDNWPYAPGKKRKKATEHDLKNVLDAYLKGNAINVKYTKAIGCFIE
jgi:hypothetical protein